MRIAQKGLSKTEFKIVELTVLGLSKKEVASKLHRSVYTVETEVKNVYQKLGLKKVQDLAVWYCGEMFNISFQISERRRQVFAICLLVLITFDIGFDHQDLFRSRRVRSRRKQETELITEL